MAWPYIQNILLLLLLAVSIFPTVITIACLIISISWYLFLYQEMFETLSFMFFLFIWVCLRLFVNFYLFIIYWTLYYQNHCIKKTSCQGRNKENAWKFNYFTLYTEWHIRSPNWNIILSRASRKAKLIIVAPGRHFCCK